LATSHQLKFDGWLVLHVGTCLLLFVRYPAYSFGSCI